MTSWRRSSNRSSSVALPLDPLNMYVFSRLTMGRGRRAARRVHAVHLPGQLFFLREQAFTLVLPFAFRHDLGARDAASFAHGTTSAFVDYPSMTIGPTALLQRHAEIFQ